LKQRIPKEEKTGEEKKKEIFWWRGGRRTVLTNTKSTNKCLFKKNFEKLASEEGPGREREEEARKERRGLALIAREGAGGLHH